MSAKTTKKIIIRTMLKLVRRKKVSDITVTEICQYAEINRRTFYRYYIDKQELLKDVYLECFFKKLVFEDSDGIWDIIEHICKQMYTDRDFFRHAFAAKEQNGFWVEFKSLMTDLYMEKVQPPSLDHELQDYFLNADLDRIFHLIEKWLRDGLKQSAEEFTNVMRASFYIDGLWNAQTAAGKELTVISKDIFLDFKEYLKQNPLIPAL